ncbi:hypothetical protein K3495_g1370 [Podosphaera aphanis]|nr:hypothetical protein K3495_g1370 [Podosphaera aphanis]
MNETGLALGVCSNSRVLSSSLKHKADVKSPNTREWVSLIETASAPPGSDIQGTKLPNFLLRQIFIPELTPTQYDYRLLLLDGHGSHADVKFMWTCYQNKVACLYLPAHTSHILQPLDLAPFSVVKSKYRQEIQAFAFVDDAAPAKRVLYNILQ